MYTLTNIYMIGSLQVRVKYILPAAKERARYSRYVIWTAVWQNKIGFMSRNLLFMQCCAVKRGKRRNYTTHKLSSPSYCGGLVKSNIKCNWKVPLSRTYVSPISSWWPPPYSIFPILPLLSSFWRSTLASDPSRPSSASSSAWLSRLGRRRTQPWHCNIAIKFRPTTLISCTMHLIWQCSTKEYYKTL